METVLSKQIFFGAAAIGEAHTQEYGRDDRR
jgi:hypothetical protein